MHKDLLFELGTEELPSGSVRPLALALANHMQEAFESAGIRHGAVHHFSTHRRLALLMEEVQAQGPEQVISRRGPAVASAGEKDKAVIGFAKSCGVSVSELSRIKTEKGEWWGFDMVKRAEPTKALLGPMLQAALLKLEIAKPMRWGMGEITFVRPVHWAVLLFGDEVVNATVLGIKTGRDSYGHRFHHPEAITITSPKHYLSLMKEVFVMADFAERRQIIIDLSEQQAALIKAKVMMLDDLVDEVTSIVEWPKPCLAQFDANFLEVPSEALIASMQSHQKCFPICNETGQLLPYFITVANLESTHPKRVIEGNEKVMRARLSDAAFFYHQDRHQPLHQYFESTKRVIFQANLGSLQDKMYRIQAMMAHLVEPLGLNPEEASRVALLSKCDLMTGMVGEFPELQGIMGSYYALHDGESSIVAQAIQEQYLPRFSADVLPTSSLGMALSIADRLDTLVGSFAIGQKPTGDKDPYKLRRHALAVVRMLLSLEAPLSLSKLILDALEGYGKEMANVDDLKPFMLERLQSHYQSVGISPAWVQAIFIRQNDWIYDIERRMSALLAFQSQPEFSTLSQLSKRVSHLLKQVSLSMNDDAVDVQSFKEPAEHELFEAVLRVERESLSLGVDYRKILMQMAHLAEPISRFFDKVMVLVDEKTLRENRCRLLMRVQAMLHGVVDFSLL